MPIILRGGIQNNLGDLERAVDLSRLVKSPFKDPRLVPGAGVTELALGSPENRDSGDTYGAGLHGIAKHAARRFASALEVTGDPAYGTLAGGGNKIGRKYLPSTKRLAASHGVICKNKALSKRKSHGASILRSALQLEPTS